jgi:chromosome segregation ATPase
MVTDIGQAVLEGIERLGRRLEGVEGRLSTTEKHLSSLNTRMSVVENRMSKIEDVVAELDQYIKTWPDMHFPASATKRQISHTQAIKADVSDIKSRMGEIFQAMATDPEIRNLRQEVSQFRNQSVDLDVRIGTIESHLGLDVTPEPKVTDAPIFAAAEI